MDETRHSRLPNDERHHLLVLIDVASPDVDTVWDVWACWTELRMYNQGSVERAITSRRVGNVYLSLAEVSAWGEEIIRRPNF